MAELFNISDAARIGLHAVLLLAQQPDERLTINELAAALGCSTAHLAKILAQLQRTGFVKGKSGPNGGYQLARSADQISLLEVYQAIEGEVLAARCPFAVPVCDGGGCPLGTFFQYLNRQVISRLSRQKLSEVKLKFGGKDGQKKEDNKDR